jgi:hypothetical protein
VEKSTKTLKNLTSSNPKPTNSFATPFVTDGSRQVALTPVCISANIYQASLSTWHRKSFLHFPYNPPQPTTPIPWSTRMRRIKLHQAPQIATSSSPSKCQRAYLQFLRPFISPDKRAKDGKCARALFACKISFSQSATVRLLRTCCCNHTPSRLVAVLTPLHPEKEI